MELEKQVISLDLARKLKELGVKQDSLFWWGYRFDVKKRPLVSDGQWKLFMQSVENPVLGSDVSAFTVAELGEMLPATITRNTDTYFLHCEKVGGWSIYYPGIKTLYIEGGNENEADVRAHMLIYLIDKKLIK